MKAQFGRPVYLFKRGKKQIFHAVFMVNGKLYSRTTRETDRDIAQRKAQEIRDQMLLAENAYQWDMSALDALFSNDALKSAFRKYCALQPDISKILRAALFLYLKSAAETNLRFSRKLSEEEKESLLK